MKTIKETNSFEIVINKSRFIGQVYRVSNTDEVTDILSLTKKKYYDARHNCYAYIIGKNQEIQKCSDDGEPSKTAGAPILDVLKKQELTNILVIVTRYFGGILLGAGGLIRAYSQATSEVLLRTKIYEIKQLLKINITLNYSLYNNILSLLNNYEILSTSFLNDVTVVLGVKENEFDDINTKIINFTKGNCTIKKDNLYDLEVPISNI